MKLYKLMILIYMCTQNVIYILLFDLFIIIIYLFFIVIDVVILFTHAGKYSKLSILG